MFRNGLICCGKGGARESPLSPTLVLGGLRTAWYRGT